LLNETIILSYSFNDENEAFSYFQFIQNGYLQKL